MFASFRRDRRCAVAVLFAIMCVVIIGLVGLAVDYGIWNETEATLTVAANTAALNAVKTAAAADLKKDPLYLTEGQQAGQQWFDVSLGQGNRAATYTKIIRTVTVPAPVGNTITATVTATTTIKSVFGNLFGIGNYQLGISAAASIDTAPYLNIEILLDNSSSMQIAASPNDIAAMLLLGPCSVAGNAANTLNGTSYDGYRFSYTNGATYVAPAITGWNGVSSFPTLPGTPPVVLTPTPGTTPGPKCATVTGGDKTANAGSPCAFACHSDPNYPPGLGQDTYALARSTLSPGKLYCSAATSLAQLSNCQIQLRFDLVKLAVQNVIQTMTTDTTSLNNLQIGVWDFDVGLNRVFPASGEASSDFATASNDVGLPPAYANTEDTGILPDQHVAAGIHADTDFNGAAAQLAQTLKPSGSGSTAANPRKVLFIVSDGAQDLTASINPIDASNCTTFKNMGYTIYVVYTPYYMSPHLAALANAPQVEDVGGTTGTPPVPAALQACASSSADYITASDLTSLTTALNTFLKSALTAPAVFTN